MGIYAGLKVHSPLSNQRRFEAVLAEIVQFLTLHDEEVQHL
jgi:hypothetical protein